MKLKVFDRKKYFDSLRRLEARKAPKYVVEAYKEGYVDAINEYYRVKLKKIISKEITINKKLDMAKVTESVHKQNKSFLMEALTQKDLEFIKAFFKMANIDLVSGDRLPPNASSLLKQKFPKSFGLEKLFKKLK